MTEIDFDAIHRRVRVHQCKVCGQIDGKWSVSPTLYELLEADPIAAFVGASKGLYVVMARCDACGFLVLIDPAVASLRRD